MNGVDLKMIEMLARTVAAVSGCKVTVSVLVTVAGEEEKEAGGILRRILDAANIPAVVALPHNHKTCKVVRHGSINLN